MAIPEELIADKIKTTIETGVPEINYVSFDKIKLSTTDFRDFELPAVQIWDLAQQIQHQMGKILVTWSLSLEIIVKSTEEGLVNQKSLWVLRHKVQKALWEKPNLEIPNVVHMLYSSNITDLHLVEPNYISRMDFDVIYYDNLTGTC